MNEKNQQPANLTNKKKQLNLQAFENSVTIAKKNKHWYIKLLF